ncbi:MAG TPA: hypothetical protein ENK13_04100, partial [Thermopetrobacter sp.]|nr:hypothetical protein [Thermopetrobacter sp.]
MFQARTDSEAHAPATAGGLVRAAAAELAARLPRRLSALATVIPRVRVRGLAIPLRPPARAHVADAEALCRGRFDFAGTRVETAGRIVFDVTCDNPDWRRALHGFSWLADLLDGDSQLWRIQARAFVSDWFERRRRLPAEALEPAVIAERVTMLVALAPRLLVAAPADFEPLLQRLLAGEFRRLLRSLNGARRPHERLLVLIAALGASLALKGLEGQREQLS